MAYFDCFVVGSWMFVIGWFLGAIYVQNRNEKTEAPRVVEKPEPCPSALNSATSQISLRSNATGSGVKISAGTNTKALLPSG
jgi:hypothetical protein